MAAAPPPRGNPVFNLPNQLTTARLVLAVVLFGLIAWEMWLWCLAVFALAALTDWLDGYLARAQGLTSALGRVLDPLVDKVLVCGTFIFLLPQGLREGQGWLAPWMVTVIVARELVITGLRNYLESLGVQFGADRLGKLKMVLQCAAIVAIFVTLEVHGPGTLPTAAAYLRDGLVYAMLLATILSGVQYLWRGIVLLRDNTQKASL